MAKMIPHPVDRLLDGAGKVTLLTHPEELTAPYDTVLFRRLLDTTRRTFQSYLPALAAGNNIKIQVGSIQQNHQPSKVYYPKDIRAYQWYRANYNFHFTPTDRKDENHHVAQFTLHYYQGYLPQQRQALYRYVNTLSRLTSVMREEIRALPNCFHLAIGPAKLMTVNSQSNDHLLRVLEPSLFQTP